MSKPESPRVLRIESVDDDMAAVLRLKTPTERLQIAFGMIDSAISMLRAMLTDQHPDWSAERIDAEVASRISHGKVPETCRTLQIEQLEEFSGGATC